MDDLVKLVEQWFIDRNLQNADPTKQMLKLFEELGELASGMARNDLTEIKDAIGDILVVLIGLSLQMDLNIDECLFLAYNEIKNRKGKLVNGVFVKESDLEHEHNNT